RRHRAANARVPAGGRLPTRATKRSPRTRTVDFAGLAAKAAASRGCVRREKDPGARGGNYGVARPWATASHAAPTRADRRATGTRSPEAPFDTRRTDC